MRSFLATLIKIHRFPEKSTQNKHFFRQFSYFITKENDCPSFPFENVLAACYIRRKSTIDSVFRTSIFRKVILMSQIKKFVLFLFILCVSAWLLSCVSSKNKASEGVAFVSGMGYGWNLGNTFDAWPNVGGRRAGLETETSWGNPHTTRKLIKYIKEIGRASCRERV